MNFTWVLVAGLVFAAANVKGQSCVYESPCDRQYAILGAISADQGNCEFSCVSAGSSSTPSYSALYNQVQCFCGSEPPDIQSILPSCTDAPYNATNEPGSCGLPDAFLSFVSVTEIETIAKWRALAVNMSEDEAGTGVLTVQTDFINMAGKTPANFATVILGLPSYPVMNVVYDSTTSVYAGFDAINSPNSYQLVPLFEDREVVVIAYYDGVLDGGTTLLHQDCGNSDKCDLASRVLPKTVASTPIQVLVECDTLTPVTGQVLECIVTCLKYGACAGQVDFGDGVYDSIVQFNAMDEPLFQIGLVDLYEQYIYPNAASMSAGTANQYYFMKDSQVQNVGIVYGWEFTATAQGLIEFMIARPQCSSGYIYCHKHGDCRASIDDCNKSPTVGKACSAINANYQYSLTERTCVNKITGSKAFVPNTKSIVYKIVHRFPFFYNGTVTDKPVVIKVPDELIFKVEAGDILAVSDRDGSLKLLQVPIASVCKLTGSPSQAASDCTLTNMMPMVTAHVIKAIKINVQHTYLSDCYTYDVIATVNGSSSLANLTVTPLSVIENVTVTLDGYVGKTNELLHFPIPLHSGRCGALYNWTWGDGTADVGVALSHFNHTYTSSAVYDVVVLAYSNLHMDSYFFTMTIQDEILDLRLNVAEVIEHLTVSDIEVLIQQGSNLSTSLTVQDSPVIYTANDHGNPNFTITHNFTELGYKEIFVNVTNLVSSLQMSAFVYVEKVIGDMVVEVPIIGYNETETVNFYLTSGTAVNYTCTFDGTPCAMWTNKLDDFQPGSVTLQQSEYLVTGPHYLVLTATNRITSNVLVVNETVWVNYIIDVPVFNVQPSTLIHPNENFTMSVDIIKGSRVDFVWNCVDEAGQAPFAEHTDYRYSIISGTVSFTEAFPTDGIYTCTTRVNNSHSLHTDTVVFTVQYAIKDFKVVKEQPWEYLENVNYDFILAAGTNVSFNATMGNGESFQSDSSNVITVRNASLANLVYNYSLFGHYEMLVTAANLISSASVTLLVLVEMRIVDFAVTTQVVPYRENVSFPVSLAAGTHINFTCLYDDVLCADYNIDWTLLQGIVNMNYGQYGTPGKHNLTLTATNLISSRTRIDKTIVVERSIVNDTVVVNSNFLDHPGDVITWVISMDEGSRVHFYLSCSDGHSDYHYEEELLSASVTFNHAFATHGVYTCDLVYNNTYYTYSDSWTFKIQYALDDSVHLLILDNLSRDILHTELTSANNFNNIVPVKVYQKATNGKFPPQPTNVSWTINYDNGRIINSTEFIATAGSPSNDFIMLQDLSLAFTAGGDYNISIQLYNEISEIYRQLEHRVYEHVFDLTAEVLHISDNLTFSAFPNKLGGVLGQSNVLLDHYDITYDLFFTSATSRGSHMTWLWEFGNGVTHSDSKSSTVYNYESADSFPGNYLIAVTVSNNVSSLRLEKALMLQRPVANLKLFVPTTSAPFNESLTWTLNFGTLGTDACYLIDFKDNNAEPSRMMAFGNLDFCTREAEVAAFQSNAVQEKFTEEFTQDTEQEKTLLGFVKRYVDIVFMTIGSYYVNFTGTNLVSSQTVELKFGVTNYPCEFPEVWMDLNDCRDSAFCNNDVKQVYRSAELEVEAIVNHDCRYAPEFEWTIFQIDEKTKEDLKEIKATPLPISTGTKLTFAPLTFPIGMYRFYLNASQELPGINTVNSSIIEIIRTPLHATFTKGPMFMTKFAEPATLDALSASYDPDVGNETSDKSGITFTWLCRRSCENFPVYDVKWNVIKPQNTFCPLYERPDVGCFFMDALNSSGIFTPETGGIVTFNTTDSYESDTLEFMVVIKKGNRVANQTLTVMLTEGDPPDITIKCGVNCEGKTNTGQKLSMEAVIHGRQPYFSYTYNWTMYNASIYPSFYDAKPISRFVYEPLIAGTGTNGPAIAFVPETFFSHNIDVTTAYVGVKVYRGKVFGFQIQKIVINTPPKPVGNCHVLPKNGTSFNTTFKVYCDDGAFEDPDGPFLYTVSSQLTATSLPSIIYQSKPTVSFRGFMLASGLMENDFNVTVTVMCYDKYNAPSSISTTVRVIPPQQTASELFESLEGAMSEERVDEDLKSGNKDGVRSLLGSVVLLLNAGSQNEYDGLAYSDAIVLYGISGTAIVQNLHSEDSADVTTTVSTVSQEVTLSPAEIAAEEERKEAEVEKRTNMRTSVVKSVAKISQDTPEDVIGATSIIGPALSNKEEAAPEAVTVATSICGKGISVLNDNLKTMTYDETKSAASAVTGVLGNLIAASGSNMKKMSEANLQGILSRKKRDAQADDIFNQLDNQVSMLDSLGKLLGTTLVVGETPETINSPNLAVLIDKQLALSFEGKATSDTGASMEISDPSILITSENNTEASVQTQFTVMTSPYHGKTEYVGQDSGSVSIAFTNGTGARLDAGGANIPSNFFLPVNNPTPSPPIISLTTRLGQELGFISKILAAGPMSISLKIAEYVVPPNVTETDNSTNTNTASSTTVSSTAANYTTDGNIGYVIYVRISEKPSVTDYDFKCTVPPVLNGSTNTYSRFSDPSYTEQLAINITTAEAGLPPGVSKSNVPNDTCFISDKVAGIINPDTPVYFSVQYFFYNDDGIIEEEGNRQKREVDSLAAEHWFTAQSYQALCKVWDPYNYDWITEGCEVGPLTIPNKTHCVCTALTFEEPEDVDPVVTARRSGYNPFSGINFAASFAVPTNTFDPTDSAFNKLSENPLIFTVMLSVVCMYLCCLIWARRWDIRDEIKAGASPLLDNDPEDSYLYEVTVFTGSHRSAGTTAKVSMIFSGMEDETPPRLIYDDKRPVLKKGGVDSFLMAVPRPLGSLNHIRVWHDNSGKSPGWQFAYMVMVDLITREKFFFVANSWFSVTEGDSILDRIVPVASKEDMTDFTHLFWTKAKQDLTDSHIWFSVFGRPHKSGFTRVQRITVCLSLLFCTMVASMYFYQGNNTVTTGQSFQIGPLSITLQQLVTGVYASLLAFPINFLIMFIFRNTKRRESRTLREVKKRQRDYEEKMDKITRKKKKSTKCMFKIKFPWWFLIIGYLMCFCCVVVSFWACVEFGGVFGPAKAERWLISFCAAFFESLLLSQPIKVVLFALFFAMVIKSPTIEEELDNDPGLLQGEEYLHTHSRKYNSEYIYLQKQLASYKKLPTPPDPEFIVAARKRKAKERQMQDVLKEILMYLIFLYLLYMVSYGSKDPSTNLFYRNAQNALQHGKFVTYGKMRQGPGFNFTSPLPMYKMGSMESFWTWCRQTYLPYVHSSVMYNGDAMPSGATQDGSNYLRGAARFRQLRMPSKNCPAASYKYEKRCSVAYDQMTEYRESYGTNWRKLTEGEAPAPGYTYKTENEIDGESYIGLMNSYGGSGYAYTLGRTQQSVADALDYLESSGWIDTDTRAVFVEFTLFNQNLNLYTVSFIVHEFLPTGAFYPRFDVKLVRLDRYKGTHAIVVLVAEIATLVYLAWFIVKELKLIRKERLQYFKEFWNLIEFSLLVLLCSATSMFFYRFYLLVELQRKLESDEGQYVNFQRAAYYEESYLFLLGFIIFTATIKVLKLLRFNKKINSLGLTLKYIASPLLSFLFSLMIVFMAFAQMSFFVYNTLLLEFNSFLESCLTLFTLMLNKFDYKSMQMANPVFAPIIFFSFTVVIGFGLISFMLTLIIEGFTAVRLDLTNKPNKYEIVDFLISKFKAVAGLGSEQLPKMHDRKEDFIQDTQSELDMKFGQFSDKVFAMFLRDPDDLKALKEADASIAMNKKQQVHKRILMS